MSNFLEECYKAIIEQPAAIKRTLESSNLPNSLNLLKTANRIILTGAGDSYIVSLFGGFAFAQLGRNTLVIEPTDIDFYSLQKGDLLIAISASGRSRKTLRTLEIASDINVETIGITENPYGSFAETVDHLWFTQANPPSYDISPSSTTTSAMSLLYWASEKLKPSHKEEPKKIKSLIQALNQSIKWAEEWGEQKAKIVHNKDIVYFLGIGPTYIACLLGMMKLHEYSLVNAIPVHIEEFTHHTKLIVNEGDPIFLLTPNNPSMQNYYQTIEMGITNVIRGNFSRLQPPLNFECHDSLLETILLLIPLQFLANYLASIQDIPIVGWKEPNVTAFDIYKG